MNTVIFANTGDTYKIDIKSSGTDEENQIKAVSNNFNSKTTNSVHYTYPVDHGYSHTASTKDTLANSQLHSHIGPKEAQKKQSKTSGFFSPEEDKVIVQWVTNNGFTNLQPIGSQLNRSQQSIKNRWKSFLNPELDLSELTEEEQRLAVKYFLIHFNQWTQIAKYFKNRPPWLIQQLIVGSLVSIRKSFFCLYLYDYSVGNISLEQLEEGRHIKGYKNKLVTRLLLDFILDENNVSSPNHDDLISILLAGFDSQRMELISSFASEPVAPIYEINDIYNKDSSDEYEEDLQGFIDAQTPKKGNVNLPTKHADVNLFLLMFPLSEAFEAIKQHSKIIQYQLGKKSESLSTPQIFPIDRKSLETSKQIYQLEKQKNSGLIVTNSKGLNSCSDSRKKLFQIQGKINKGLEKLENLKLKRTQRTKERELNFIQNVMKKNGENVSKKIFQKITCKNRKKPQKAGDIVIINENVLDPERLNPVNKSQSQNGLYLGKRTITQE